MEWYLPHLFCLTRYPLSLPLIHFQAKSFLTMLKYPHEGYKLKMRLPPAFFVGDVSIIREVVNFIHNIARHSNFGYFVYPGNVLLCICIFINFLTTAFFCVPKVSSSSFLMILSNKMIFVNTVFCMQVSELTE